MQIDWTQVDNQVIDGVDSKDYPDFCDAYIASCDYMGRDATEEELEAITEGWDDNMPSTLGELAYQSLI